MRNHTVICPSGPQNVVTNGTLQGDVSVFELNQNFQELKNDIRQKLISSER